MAAWPTLARLKAVLGVDSEIHDDALTSALEAAIEQVISDTGTDPDEADDLVPTSSLAEAALLLAVIVSKAPDAPFGVAAVFDVGGIYVAREHPTYRKLLKGSRVSFGVA